MEATGLTPLSWTTQELVADYRPEHGWLIGLDGFAAAKRLQLEGFARTLLFHGDCLRSRLGSLVHGPLSQPVVELCLKIPADILAASGVSRGLARRAFAQRLPSNVIRREAKGDLTSAYGRELAADLSFVRAFLLEGRLAAQGLLDRDSLEAGLSRPSFVWHGAFADVTDLMAIEGWVRAWEGRALQGAGGRTTSV